MTLKNVNVSPLPGTVVSIEEPISVRCLEGPLRGKILTITGIMSIGREPKCSIHIEDPKLSRHHGTFMVRDGVLHYRDYQSTNGSFVNGARVVDAVLAKGDVLRLGATHLTLVETTSEDPLISDELIPAVTNMIATNSVQADALARKFSEIFEYYKDQQPEISEAERYELVRTQRALNGLKNLFAVSQDLTQLVSVEALIDKLAKYVFEMFSSAENLVILLHDDELGRVAPKLSISRTGLINPQLSISRTVLNRSVENKATVVANDAATDDRFAASDSLMTYEVKGVLCAPLVVNDGVLGALYLDNRMNPLIYDEFDGELLTAFANQAAVALSNALRNDELQKHYHQTLQALVNAIEAKDAYTKGHTERVKKYALAIGRELELPAARLEKLQAAADLHDIGKIGIKEGLINKEGKLTDTEFHRVKDHVELGERILAPITYLRDILPIIRGHHERWDGSGYPDGLRGDEAPLEARILAVADSFDAMTTKRAYNEPMSYDVAFSKINAASGKLYDPQVVDAFAMWLQRERLGGTQPSRESISKPRL